MPINSLTLDPKNPAFAEAIKGCVVGDSKTFTVTGNVLAMGNRFVLDVTEAEYAEPEVEEEEVTEEVSEDVVEKPMVKEKPNTVLVFGMKAKK